MLPGWAYTITQVGPPWQLLTVMDQFPQGVANVLVVEGIDPGRLSPHPAPLWFEEEIMLAATVQQAIDGIAQPSKIERYLARQVATDISAHGAVYEAGRAV